MNHLGTTQLLLVTGSLSYFSLHSMLASVRAKRFVAHRFPRLMPDYRLFFNALAVILLLPLLWLILQDPGPLLWAWQGPWKWLMTSISYLALIGLLWSTRSYDMSVFLGLRQWRERRRQTGDPETLHITPLHRFVRHPWYFLGLLMLWSRDQYLNQTLFYALATAYLVVGSRLEEHKLVHQYGDAYRLYRHRVPGLIPLPWRWLKQPDAERLTRLAREQDSSLR